MKRPVNGNGVRAIGSCFELRLWSEKVQAAGVSEGSDDESLWDSRVAEAEPHDSEPSGATSVYTRGFESEDLPPRSVEDSPFVARDDRCRGPLTCRFYAAIAIDQTNPQSSRATATTAV